MRKYKVKEGCGSYSQQNSEANEISLMAPEIQMKAILDNLPYMAWLKDTDGRFVFVNQSYASSCGKSKEEIIGLMDYDIWPQKLAEQYRADDQEVMATGNQKSVEEIVDDIKGETWVETFKSPIFNSDGKVIGTTGINRDISERKLVEKKILEQTTLLMGLLDSIPEIVFFKDLNGVFLGCNKEHLKLVGKTSEELVGHSDYDFYDKKTADFYRENDLKALQEEHPRHNEEWVNFPDGTKVLLDTVKTRLCDPTGNVIGMIGVSRDVTERKYFEDDLRNAKEAAEAANVMKSQFLANMSHEIRTPLNGILGFLEMLASTTPSTEQKEYINEAKSASNVLLYLINDILDFSKIESGRLSMEHIPFNLKTIVRETAGLLRRKAQDKGIELLTDLGPDVPESMIGDPSRLKQVLGNIVSNAVKFTDQGEIRIFVDLLEKNDGFATIRFQVKDTGIGISPENAQKLFKPFIQADASTTRKYGGTGLGLAISRELVRIMGGEISLESTLGTGSTFTFTIHLRIDTKIDAAEEAQKSNQNVGLGKSEEIVPQELKRSILAPRLLLTEDNEMNIRLISNFLKKQGLTCDVARNGQEAVEAVSVKEYDIILMDCQMPVMDGYESSRRIRSLEVENRKTPIIAMTANAMEGDREKCIEAGMSDYISKPIDFRLLLQIIRKYTLPSDGVKQD